MWLNFGYCLWTLPPPNKRSPSHSPTNAIGSILCLSDGVAVTDTFRTHIINDLQSVNDLVVLVKSDPRVPDDRPVLVPQFQLQVSGSAIFKITESLLRDFEPEMLQMIGLIR